MAKDDSTVRCFQGLLIFGNVVIGMCGIALTAECIFFVSDQHSLYPLLEATNNDDIYGAAWIGMFVGICLFCLSVLGIVGIMKSNRKILLAYFILMFIVYGFEVASCITAATQRDFFTPNLFLKQMLERYQNSSPPNNDDQWKNNGVTRTWDRLMLQDNCCGVNGPSDWQKYTSAFRTENSDADYPWPRQCCVMNNLKEPLNLEACKLGVPGYYHNQGCYELISGPMNRHAWGVAWFGFAILCWTGCTCLYSSSPDLINLVQLDIKDCPLSSWLLPDTNLPRPFQRAASTSLTLSFCPPYLMHVQQEGRVVVSALAEH
uniref:Uroplakin-1b n=1 Tax=Equus caballus TaxID=9796 RepID=F7ACP8_HORSE